MADNSVDLHPSRMFYFPMTLPIGFDATRISATDPLYPALKREALNDTPIAAERRRQAENLLSRGGIPTMAPLLEWDWVRFVMSQRRDQMTFIHEYLERNGLPSLPVSTLPAPSPSAEYVAAILAADGEDARRWQLHAGALLWRHGIRVDELEDREWAQFVLMHAADQEEFAERLQRERGRAGTTSERKRRRSDGPELREAWDGPRKQQVTAEMWQLSRMMEELNLESDTESLWATDSLEDDDDDETESCPDTDTDTDTSVSSAESDSDGDSEQAEEVVRVEVVGLTELMEGASLSSRACSVGY